MERKAKGKIRDLYLSDRVKAIEPFTVAKQDRRGWCVFNSFSEIKVTAKKLSGKPPNLTATTSC